MRPPTACQEPSRTRNGMCGQPSVPGSTFCKDHVNDNSRTRQRQEHDHWRSQQAYRQLYQLAAWGRTRLSILARDPVCKVCNRAVSEVADHINDHKGNIQMFFSPHNLRGVCKPCHDHKTGTEHGFNTPSTPAPGGVVATVVPAQVATKQPPTTLLVDPIHRTLPDGTNACKKEYARWYRKSGDRWVLLPEDFKPI